MDLTHRMEKNASPWLIGTHLNSWFLSSPQNSVIRSLRGSSWSDSLGKIFPFISHPSKYWKINKNGEFHLRVFNFFTLDYQTLLFAHGKFNKEICFCSSSIHQSTQKHKQGESHLRVLKFLHPTIKLLLFLHDRIL